MSDALRPDRDALRDATRRDGDGRLAVHSAGELGDDQGSVWRRTVVWTKYDPPAIEFADITRVRDRLTAEGVGIATEPIPYRLDYSLQTTAGFVTSRLSMSTRGNGWRRMLDLCRDANGVWQVAADADGEVELPPPGGGASALGDALDCDIAFSPLTNLMPILRYDLLSGGGPIEIVTAWVSVPDLSVHPDGQRYTFVRSDGSSRVVRFEATDDGFTADIELDADGVVVDYPSIGRIVRRG